MLAIAVSKQWHFRLIGGLVSYSWEDSIWMGNMTPEISLQEDTHAGCTPAIPGKPWMWRGFIYTAGISDGNRHTSLLLSHLQSCGSAQQQCVSWNWFQIRRPDVRRWNVSYLKSMNKGVVNMYKSPMVLQQDIFVFWCSDLLFYTVFIG